MVSGTPDPRHDNDVNHVAARWMDRHGNTLFRYALARVGDPSAAEDLVQETLLAALRGIAGFRGESAERTWLTGILRHKIMDHFRRVARERAIWADVDEPPETDTDFDAEGQWRGDVARWNRPEQALEQAEFWSVFEQCVGALPEKLRTPFALREVEGVQTEVLADLLSVSKNNLWVMLSRARQRLRRCLQHHWFADR